ncbi:MAG TPA: rhodanese-like domain-containing protein [Cyclobacteriaceae bacterium]|nr:rhodanese-like domain-containing protein [Cyclobacteriaceae bacterium]
MFKLFSKTKAYKDLDGVEFKEAYSKSKQAVLLDVRSAYEFTTGTIPGAKHLDIMSPEFQQQIESLDKSKDYFIFCRSGSRSAAACRMMAQLGLNTYNLREGIGGWPR